MSIAHVGEPGTNKSIVQQILHFGQTARRRSFAPFYSFSLSIWQLTRVHESSLCVLPHRGNTKRQRQRFDAMIHETFSIRWNGINGIAGILHTTICSWTRSAQSGEIAWLRLHVMGACNDINCQCTTSEADGMGIRREQKRSIERALCAPRKSAKRWGGHGSTQYTLHANFLSVNFRFAPSPQFHCTVRSPRIVRVLHRPSAVTVVVHNHYHSSNKLIIARVYSDVVNKHNKMNERKRFSSHFIRLNPTYRDVTALSRRIS